MLSCLLPLSMLPTAMLGNVNAQRTPQIHHPMTTVARLNAKAQLAAAESDRVAAQQRLLSAMEALPVPFVVGSNKASSHASLQQRPAANSDVSAALTAVTTALEERQTTLPLGNILQLMVEATRRTIAARSRLKATQELAVADGVATPRQPSPRGGPSPLPGDTVIEDQPCLSTDVGRRAELLMLRDRTAKTKAACAARLHDIREKQKELQTFRQAKRESTALFASRSSNSATASLASPTSRRDAFGGRSGRRNAVGPSASMLALSTYDPVLDDTTEAMLMLSVRQGGGESAGSSMLTPALITMDDLSAAQERCDQLEYVVRLQEMTMRQSLTRSTVSGPANSRPYDL